MKFDNDNILVLALKLFIICLVVAFGLSYLNSITAIKINETKQKDQQLAFSEVLPNCKFEKINDKVFKASLDGALFGYAANVSSKGYGGDIEMIVGMDKTYKITGIKFVSMPETPGLGTKVKEDSFISQFLGKLLNENELKAITGATISSKAVHSGINKAVIMAKEVAN
jgi:electron transport complex protein RnfG